jgi:hypothetical protein
VTGVEDHHIGALGRIGRGIAQRRQQIRHLGGIIGVHLAPIGFDEELLHESIFDDNEPKPRPYSRWTATVFLIGGLLFSFILGYIVGLNVDFVAISMPTWFSTDLKPEFLFYPPIIVLFVDMMHGFASRFD